MGADKPNGQGKSRRALQRAESKLIHTHRHSPDVTHREHEMSDTL